MYKDAIARYNFKITENNHDTKNTDNIKTVIIKFGQ